MPERWPKTIFVKIKRGEVWLANLDPTQGSEQAGTLPAVVFQNDLINKYRELY